MTVQDLLDRVRALPPETPVCVAEVDEAAGMNIAGLEVVRDARRQGAAADGAEAIELANGGETVVVLRW